jgi:FlaA1/EpsC-like NDP-sugar epimerase
MGEQIKVADLARNMIVLSGLVPGKDIQIVYTGLRPGEKLYEELFEAGEQVEPTSHPKIHRAIGGVLPAEDLDAWIKELPDKLSDCEDDEVLQDLKRLVPSFHPLISERVS